MAENPVQALTIIERIFSNWTALRMAVEHGNGSVESAHNFCEYIAQTLAMNGRLHYTDISGELDDYMDDIFNTKLEDDSEKQVAEDVVRFHNYIVAKDIEALTTELERLPPLQPWIMPNLNVRLPRAPRIDDSDSEDSDDVEENGGDGNDNDQGGEAVGASSSKASGMEVDSDGWSVIRRKKSDSC